MRAALRLAFGRWARAASGAGYLTCALQLQLQKTGRAGGYGICRSRWAHRCCLSALTPGFPRTYKVHSQLTPRARLFRSSAASADARRNNPAERVSRVGADALRTDPRGPLADTQPETVTVLRPATCAFVQKPDRSADSGRTQSFRSLLPYMRTKRGTPVALRRQASGGLRRLTLVDGLADGLREEHHESAS